MNVVVSDWPASAVVLAAYAVVAAVHLLGVRGSAAAGRGDGAAGSSVGGSSARPPRLGWEAVAFQAGLLLAVVALVSPLGYWSGVYIWVRSVQDLLLALVAPALMVLGAPWQPLRRGLARGPLASWARSASGGGQLDGGRLGGGRLDARPRPTHGWLTVPVGVTVAYGVIWWGWHLPWLYDAAVRQPLVGAAEVVMYLGGGIALWCQLIGSRPYVPGFASLQRAMLVVGVTVSGTILGMILTFGSGVLYHAYRTPLHLHPYSVIVDQQVGGAVLWLMSMPPLLIAGVALLIQWLNDEEADAASAGADRLLKPRKAVWPTRPALTHRSVK